MTLLLAVAAASTVAADEPTPALGNWRVVSTLKVTRGGAAVVLGDGRVLLTGGYAHDKYLRSAEVWDPRTLKSKVTGSMVVRRAQHTATLLADGRVLITGGESGGPEESGTQDTAEIWDPFTNRFSQTGSMHGARRGHTAVLLADGRVAVADGTGDAPDIEVWSPASGTWSAVVDPDRQRYDDLTLAARQGGGLVEFARTPSTVVFRRWQGQGNIETLATLDAKLVRELLAIDDSRVLIIYQASMTVWDTATRAHRTATLSTLGADAFPCWPRILLAHNRLMCSDSGGPTAPTVIIDLNNLVSAPSGTAKPSPSKPFILLEDGRVLSTSGAQILLWTPTGWKQ